MKATRGQYFVEYSIGFPGFYRRIPTSRDSPEVFDAEGLLRDTKALPHPYKLSQ